MTVYCNNCQGKDHQTLHNSPDAFFDLWPKHYHLAPNLKSDQECIVATRVNGQITFSWFKFTRALPGTYQTKPCKVFYGKCMKTSGPYSQAQAAGIVGTFFNSRGHFNQWPILMR